ncbi:MAG: S-adenosylmethionine:tRNA ribosyltransferase-isomerase [Dysgonamonadaceae bacterium]|jgi:S-adenosylmethionine:tRNA ribosyltransferase-isomerase|nr:S-adenosylmethionine:tRNA ribosyltransferase-isomerase [Dysgonamonadaceae bacterium]
MDKIALNEIVRKIRINDYHYRLPDEKIAKFPLEKRDESRLLVYRDGAISEKPFKQLHEALPDDCTMVFNNTKVIQARLVFRKDTGAAIEVFCLEPENHGDYALAFRERETCRWLCLVGNSGKWKSGKISIRPSNTARNLFPDIVFTAERLANYGDTHLIGFEWNKPSLTFADVLEMYGELPIPPYLNRKTEEQDKERYQTVYSKIEGSVAAPTAGLHFTTAVLNDLKKRHIHCEEVTLHVGAGTFKPVKSELIEGHAMHVELMSVEKTTLERLLKNTGRVYAVGTTSVRTLESLYYIGVLLEQHPDLQTLEVSQWMPYQEENNRISVVRSLENILQYLAARQSDTLTASTKIMIAPGYSFKITEGIITNFHQPQSTLLLLISAFIGEDWKKVYDYALTHDFRFLSYGDSSLLMKGSGT